MRVEPDFNEGLIRHIVLSTLLRIRKRYPDEGEMVICGDYGHSWRKSIFPYYKAGRSEAREASEIDYKKLFEIVATISKEIDDFMPYKYLKIEGAEADDIIATLAQTVPGNHVIISNDKDFKQLTMLNNVRHYLPLKEEEVKGINPEKFLFELIVRGDGGDGIPNIKSKPDSFVTKTRQKSIFTKDLESWWEKREVPEEFRERFEQNKKLIDLFEIPQEISEKIINGFESAAPKTKRQMQEYFMEKRLRLLLSDISDF